MMIDLDRATIVLLLFVIMILGFIVYQLSSIGKTLERWEETPPVEEPELPPMMEAEVLEAEKPLGDGTDTIGTFKGPTPWM